MNIYNSAKCTCSLDASANDCMLTWWWLDDLMQWPYCSYNIIVLVCIKSKHAEKCNGDTHHSVFRRQAKIRRGTLNHENREKMVLLYSIAANAWSLLKLCSNLNNRLNQRIIRRNFNKSSKKGTAFQNIKPISTNQGISWGSGETLHTTDKKKTDKMSKSSRYEVLNRSIEDRETMIAGFGTPSRPLPTILIATIPT